MSEVTRSKRIESLLRKLWATVPQNPLALIAINRIMESRKNVDGMIYEDELPDDYDYDAGYSQSQVIDGVRMFPIQVKKESGQ